MTIPFSPRRRPRLHEFVSLLVALVALAAPLAAQDVPTLPFEDVQEGSLTALDNPQWSFKLDSDQGVRLVLTSDSDLFVNFMDPEGWNHGTNTGGGEYTAGWRASAGDWRVTLGMMEEGTAEYQLRLIRDDSQTADGPIQMDSMWSATGDPFEGEEYQGHSGFGGPEDWDDEEAAWAGMGYGDEGGPGGGASSVSTAVVDVVVELLSGTVAPFLLLLAIQAITVFFVLRFMMRPSQARAEVTPPDTGRPEERARASGELGLLESGTSCGIVLTGPAHARFQRCRGTARQILAGLFGCLLLHLLVSLILVAIVPDVTHTMVLVTQVPISIVLFLVALGRQQATGHPLSTIYAVVVALVLLVPAAVGLRFESVLCAVPWLVVPVGLTAILRKSGKQARELGKHDLLVLRVFGSDASAASTFGTLARFWRFLGPVVTIADPSYVRYEFSATERGNRWKMGATAAVFGIAMVAFQNDAARQFLAGLPGLGSMTPEQLQQVGTIGAFALVVPLAILPIFIAVKRRFIRDRAALLGRIDATMGATKRWNGVYTKQPYYCYDDLWRPAVHEMMRNAEVVLMDFRSFDPSKKGCEYEIGKVLDTVSIHRIVLLLDEDTDHDAMFALFRDRWSDVHIDSPNCDAPDPMLKVFTARTIPTWRDGIWKWLVSIPQRQRRWVEDAERILGFLASASGGEVAPRLARTEIEPAPRRSEPALQPTIVAMPTESSSRPGS